MVQEDPTLQREESSSLHIYGYYLCMRYLAFYMQPKVGRRATVQYLSLWHNTTMPIPGVSCPLLASYAGLKLSELVIPRVIHKSMHVAHQPLSIVAAT